MHRIAIRNIFLGILLLAVLRLPAQTDSCALRISLLTCTPGQELYSTFGHTAIRVTDSTNDIVFNYGTFSFDDPDFYMKFVRGKLNYFLSAERFADFDYAYQYEQRGITEQVLNLSCAEKRQLFDALIENAQEANRNYKYDFLFDNCTTRAGQIIRKQSSQPILLGNFMPAELPTFRNMIHTYLDRGGQQWSKLGIDILLGSRIDRAVTREEAMFLPDYLMNAFDSAKAGSKPLVQSSRVILNAPRLNPEKSVAPWLVFALLFGLIALLSFVKAPAAKIALRIFDGLFFTLLGFLGVLLLFMWLGTDHGSCANNYNLLWALPVHFIMIWLPRNSPLRRRYFLGVAVLTSLLMLAWNFLPQEFNFALFPVMALIVLRSIQISRKS